MHRFARGTKEVKQASAFAKALDQLEVSLYDFAGWYRYILEEQCKKGKKECEVIEKLESVITIFLPDFANLQLEQGRPPRFSVLKHGNRLYLDPQVSPYFGSSPICVGSLGYLP